MKRSELLDAIKAVMVGVEKSDNTFGMDLLIFDNQWIRGFKDLISVSYPFESNISAAVRGDELYKILSKMDGDEVELIMEANDKSHRLVIKDNQTLLKMNAIQSESHNLYLERIKSLKTDSLEWYEIPKDFMKGLGLCIFSAGSDSALDILAGVHFENDIITATDNYRISVFNMNGGVISPFTIPTKAVQGFLQIDTEFTIIAVSPAWIHLGNKVGAIFSARLLSGTYPLAKIMGVFDMMKFNEAKVSFIFPDGIDKSLDRAEVLAGGGVGELDKLTQVTICNSKGNFVIQATRDIGEIVDTIPWPKNPMPEGITLKLSPDFLRKVKSISKEYKLSPTKKSVLFLGENFKQIMIARVE